MKKIALIALVFTQAASAAVVNNCKQNVSIADPVFGNAYVPAGDGVTDDTQAIQKALDYVACNTVSGKIVCTPITDPKGANCQLPTSIYIPYTAKGYVTGSVWLHSNQWISGTGATTTAAASTLRGKNTGGKAVIIADSSFPTFQNAAGVTTSNGVNHFGITGLSISNTDGPAVTMNSASNFILSNSSFISTVSSATSAVNAIEMVNSYRGVIENCIITQMNGVGFAISAMNNVNGLSIYRNNFNQGASANGINLGQSQAVTISSNLFNGTNVKYGIVVSGQAVGSGISSALNISNNRFTDVRRPITLAPNYLVYGATITGNTAVNAKVDADYFIYLGPVSASLVSNNSYTGTGKDYSFVLFGYLPDPRTTLPQYLDNSTISLNTLNGSADINCKFTSSFPSATFANLNKINQISFPAPASACTFAASDLTP